MPFRIAIIGDTHFGFLLGTERGDDSFLQARSALLAALSREPDLIILPGDVFDSPIPRQETLARAAEILRIAGKVPIAAINGTHERRPKGLTNPLHVLAKAGVINYISNSSFILEKQGGEKLAVFGMGGVPESFAKDVLKVLSPKPVEGATNVFVFHQSVTPFVFTKEGEGLSLFDLPEGFDLLIDGHLHWPFLERHPATGTQVIFSGSTIMTQVRKGEAGEKKAVWIAELGTVGSEARIERIPLEPERRSFLLEVSEREELEKSLAGIEASLSPSEKKPIVRVKFSGEERDQTLVLSKYVGKFILSFERASEALANTQVAPNAEAEAPASPERRAADTLRRLLGKDSPDNLEEIFSLLLEGKGEEALSRVG